MDSENPRIGIVTAGKSYLDLRQALDDSASAIRKPRRSACASSRWA